MRSGLVGRAVNMGSTAVDVYENGRSHAVIAAEDMARGGAQRVTHDIIDALTEAGWQCSLLVEQRSRLQGWLCDTQADRVLRMCHDDDLVQYCSGADALLINLSSLAYSAIGRVAYEHPNLQRIAIVHDENSLNPAFLAARPWLHKIIAVSNRLTRHLIQMGCPPSSVFRRHWGIDLDRFRPDPDARWLERKKLGLAEEERLVLWVARLAQGKRPSLAVETLRHLADTTKLAFVGEGGELPVIQQRISRYGLKQRVRVLGAVSDERLPGLYNAADVSLLTSEMEACPLVLQESMACGTPVVASNIGAISELVSPGCGELVDSDDPYDYAQALIRVMKGTRQ